MKYITKLTEYLIKISISLAIMIMLLLTKNTSTHATQKINTENAEVEFYNYQNYLENIKKNKKKSSAKQNKQKILNQTKQKYKTKQKILEDNIQDYRIKSQTVNDMTENLNKHKKSLEADIVMELEKKILLNKKQSEKYKAEELSIVDLFYQPKHVKTQKINDIVKILSPDNNLYLDELYHSLLFEQIQNPTQNNNILYKTDVLNRYKNVLVDSKKLLNLQKNLKLKTDY